MGTIVDGGLQAFGALISGQANAAADKYNSQLATRNAAIFKENAAIVGQAGAEQAAQVGQKSRATVGAIRANQGASGVDVNSGSAVDTRVSADELGELDAMTVRSNATKEAYGFQVQAANEEAESNLDKFKEKSDNLGSIIGAAGTFLGSVEDAESKMISWQSAGGFGG